MNFFIDIILPAASIFLQSTRPVTEMITKIIAWGKDGRCLGLTVLPSSCADCLETWEPQSPGKPRACAGQLQRLLIFYIFFFENIAFYQMSCKIWHGRAGY
jgi:hypothetical protein